MAEVTLDVSEELEELVDKKVEEKVTKILKEQGRTLKYPPFMRLKDAARYMQVSRSTFDNIRKRSSIPIINIEGIVLIEKKVLDEFILSHSEKAVSE